MTVELMTREQLLELAALDALGLLDEYEALSGISAIYPKTPLSGSENSRMGVSMKVHTRFLPLHHYAVLRRYHCAGETRDPHRGVLQAP